MYSIASLFYVKIEIYFTKHIYLCRIFLWTEWELVSSLPSIIIFIFLIILFSSWHILILVTLNISPICWRVIGPDFAAISVQLEDVGHEIQYLQLDFLHSILNFSWALKHFIYKTLNFILIIHLFFGFNKWQVKEKFLF